MRSDEVPTILEDVAIPWTYMKLRHYTDHVWEILDANDIPQSSGSCDMTQEQFLESLKFKPRIKKEKPE